MGYVWAFVIDSDKLISAAKHVGIATAVVTILLVIAIVVMRASWLNQQRHRKAILRKWRPILHDALIGKVPAKLPYLFRGDRLYFLEFWNYLQESVKGESRERLNEIARRIKMLRTARYLSNSQYLWRQLLGVTALGWLGDADSWDRIEGYARSDDPVVSITSARALVHIDAERAVPILMPILRKRKDWSETKIATILQEAGTPLISRPLADAMVGATPRQQTLLMHLSGAVNSQDGLTASRVRLSELTEDHTPEHAPVILAGLRLLGESADAPLARKFLTHPDWNVRVEAAHALGRIGDPEDEKRLTLLLRDEHWWVRYRAAQALANMPQFSHERLLALEKEQAEPAAKDILKHVIAERELA